MKSATKVTLRQESQSDAAGVRGFAPVNTAKQKNKPIFFARVLDKARSASSGGRTPQSLQARRPIVKRLPESSDQSSASPLFLLDQIRSTAQIIAAQITQASSRYRELSHGFSVAPGELRPGPYRTRRGRASKRFDIHRRRRRRARRTHDPAQRAPARRQAWRHPPPLLEEIDRLGLKALPDELHGGAAYLVSTGNGTCAREGHCGTSTSIANVLREIGGPSS